MLDIRFPEPIYFKGLKNNIDVIRQDETIKYMNPFLPIDNKDRLITRLAEEFPDIPFNEIKEATEAAYSEQLKFKKDIEIMGQKALKEIKERKLHAIVLAGRPYHIDPEINHGIPELITSLGLAVLTEDSIAHLGKIERLLRVVDQWVYHNRLYRAANFVSTKPNLELVQLTSFGCGIDAVTSDQVEEILRSKGRMYTLVKIDEGANLGAIRIRMRSLIAAMKERERHNIKIKKRSSAYHRIVFQKDMKQKYTILVPEMSPIHFGFFQKAFELEGYNFKVLPITPNDVECGLQNVNNDACYPSIVTTGQLLNALQSGQYDQSKTALLITQTGGGCRATNYIGFIRRALNDNGLSHVPVIGLSFQGFEKNPGFRLSAKLAYRVLVGALYGDLMLRCLYRVRPYELIPGSANALYSKLNDECMKAMESLSIIKYSRQVKRVVQQFDNLPLKPPTEDNHKPRIGVVGEILVKFHPGANNQIVETIEKEGAEAVVPDLMDFVLYAMANSDYKHKKLNVPLKTKLIANAGILFIDTIRRPMINALNKSKRFLSPSTTWELQKDVEKIVQVGNQMGEGWLLTAEMMELIKQGVPSIACIQPFACLPNHVTGKGMIKELRRRYPGANISAIDYDPGASEVNQINRLKLLLANAPIGCHPDETKTPEAIKYLGYSQ